MDVMHWVQDFQNWACSQLVLLPKPMCRMELVDLTADTAASWGRDKVSILASPLLHN